MEQERKIINVFVTYRQENDDYQRDVIAFTDFLRQKGFHAKMDELVRQEETSIDFPRMMHGIFTDYDKVIILLSPGYKERAEKFVGGVGAEYGLLIKDFEANKNKYILATLFGMDDLDSQTPLFLKGKDVVDLKNSNFQSNLFAKLTNRKLIEFSPVGAALPVVEAAKPKPFIQTPNLVIVEPQVKSTGSNSHSGGLINHIEYKASFSIKNDSSYPVSDYSFELCLPVKFYSAIESGYRYNKIAPEIISSREENGYSVVHIDGRKIFPAQAISLCNFQFKLRRDIFFVLNQVPVIVKIYSESGLIEKSFNLNEYLFDTLRPNEKITFESFN